MGQMKTIHDFALDILQERQNQLVLDHKRAIKELDAKQDALINLSTIVRAFRDRTAKLETDMADLERAIEVLNQSADSVK